MRVRTVFSATALAAVLGVAGVGCNGGDAPPAVSIHKAAASGDLDALRANLAAGVDIHERGRSDATPLHSAVWERQAGAVRALVEAGANPDLLDGKDWSPLHYAVQNGFDDLVELFRSLIANGIVNQCLLLFVTMLQHVN